MDGTHLAVSAAEPYARLGTASAPVLVDVRRQEAFRQEAFEADDRQIICAVRRAPEEADLWSGELPVRPWLISRFIDPGVEFTYVPPDQVTAVAEQIGGIPYDIKGTEFGHVGDRCSFGAIVRIFDIKEPALDRVATVVRGADTSQRHLAPECEGLYAISFGLSANFPDDHEMLRHGLVIYDALYTWRRKALGPAAAQPLNAQA